MILCSFRSVTHMDGSASTSRTPVSITVLYFDCNYVSRENWSVDTNRTEIVTDTETDTKNF